MEKSFAVRAVHCDHRASDDEVYARLVDATAPLTRSWQKLERAKRILLKVNMSRPPAKLYRFAGRRRELVDEAVLRATLRLLRERTGAELVTADAIPHPPEWPAEALNYRPVLEEFGVRHVDADLPPMRDYEVPGGGQMFDRYRLNAIIGEADAFVSVAKLKNHLFQGVTLSLKNLFGLPPMAPHGRTRRYFHHIIRLSYVLPDLGRITNGCLNIVDGLIGQAGREWDGEGRVSNTLIAGDHPIATDACGAWLMGHDPAADWPAPPYLRDRNTLKVAAEGGFGSVDLSAIDFQTEVTRPLGAFYCDPMDPPEVVAAWRRSTCEQALYYRDNRARLADRYAGQYILLQRGEVIWHGDDPTDLPSRRLLSKDHRNSGIWMKLVDPKEYEGEHFEVYERELALMNELVNQPAPTSSVK